MSQVNYYKQYIGIYIYIEKERINKSSQVERQLIQVLMLEKKLEF